MASSAVLAGLVDFRRLDLLATGDTALHRLDARVKVIVALTLVVCVMSFGRYEVAALIPYFAVPIVVVAATGLPAGLIWRKVAAVIPIALLIGLPNALLDRGVVAGVGGLELAGGWVSMLSIVLRALLAAAAAIVLVAITGFPAICGALERLGVPQALAVQLLFLYRYLTVLGEEALRTTTARELRGGGRALSMRVYVSLAGRLLLRTWDRAERIHLAMCARGFTGEFPAGRDARFGWRETAGTAGACALLVLLRTHEPAQRLGAALVEILR